MRAGGARLGRGRALAWLCGLWLVCWSALGGAQPVGADETFPGLGATRTFGGSHILPLREIRFEGALPDEALLKKLQAQLSPWIGRRAAWANLDEIIGQVDTTLRQGSLDLQLQTGRADGVRLAVQISPVRSYLDHLEVHIDGDPALGAWAMDELRRGGQPLPEVGQVWHGWLGRRLQGSLQRWARTQGYLEATAELVLRERGELVEAELSLTRGPLHVLRTVLVEGMPDALDDEEALQFFNENGPLRPQDLETAQERLLADLCAYGYDQARVGVRFEGQADGMDLTFEVRPGRRSLIQRLTVQGRPMPRSLSAPISEGQPFCEASLDHIARLAEAWMATQGVFNAHVRWRAEREGTGVAVTFTLDDRSLGPVRRIWFEGNTVTQEKILRQFLAIREGQRPERASIHRSLENLRRSGLVRRASARLVPNGEGDGYYLWISVREWEFLSVDPTNRRFTLHNLNLYHWPRHLDEQSVRGAGQEASARIDPRDLELSFEDPFMLPHASGGFMVARQVRSYGFLSESTDSLRLIFGGRALQNRLSVLPILQVSQTRPSAPSTYEGLPLRWDSPIEVGLGLRARLNLSRLDEERVNYFGFDFGLDMLSSLYVRPNSGFLLGQAKVGFYLPVWRFQKGQHMVLRLAAEGGWLVTSSRSYGHQRVGMQVRGYAADALRVSYALPDGTEARLGGRAGYKGVAELRVPLFLRRHALIPFFEVGTVGAGLDHRPWDTVFPGAGLRYFFSFFGERLEGYVEGAWGFKGGASRDYLGVGGGGSF